MSMVKHGMNWNKMRNWLYNASKYTCLLFVVLSMCAGGKEKLDNLQQLLTLLVNIGTGLRIQDAVYFLTLRTHLWRQTRIIQKQEALRIIQSR